ncbi:MAG: hypothetical protein IPM85_06660 [Chitinophagaceae bacterium]|nr:hypothetical protein [Chitinophagaceae bacterium]
MKTSSPFLWQLIRSLNSSEKLFFKRNYSAVNRKEDKTYLKLFSAISAQKNYDETEILIKLSPAVNKKILPIKNTIYNSKSVMPSFNTMGKMMHSMTSITKFS